MRAVPRLKNQVRRRFGPKHPFRQQLQTPITSTKHVAPPTGGIVASMGFRVALPRITSPPLPTTKEVCREGRLAVAISRSQPLARCGLI